MIRSIAPKKVTLRRLATFAAAAGVLLTSSGVALMVAAAPANAASTPVNICHATSSDSNPYVFITVDDDSAKFKGHLEHRNDPNKTWKNAGTFNGVPHAAGDPKPDLIASFIDDQNVAHIYDGNITASSCDAEVVVLEAIADVDFFGPTCEFPTRAEWDGTGINATFAVFSGSETPGSAIVVRATATNGAVFDGGGTTQDFPFQFPAAVDPNSPPCVIVSPPGVATATVDFVDPSCANLNEASYSTAGDNVDFSIKSGSAAPGADIVVTATATGDAEFDGGGTTKDFAHTFGAAVDLNGDPCVVVEPPVVTPPTVIPPIATPTVVHSGLVSAEDLRGEQGRILLVTGMVLMVLGGSLGLASARRARS